MNLKNIFKIYQKANEKYSVIHPASAIISVGDSEIELNIPGVPSVIEITYSGICNIGNQIPITCKFHLSKNKIIIINVFRINFPSVLFLYSGKIVIEDCEILTFKGDKFKATINNNQLQESIQGQRTKAEDDTMIIVDDYETEIKTPFKRGSRTHSIISTIQETKNKISGFSKEEKIGLANTIAKHIVKTSRPPVVTQAVKQPAKQPPKKTQAKGKY